MYVHTYVCTHTLTQTHSRIHTYIALQHAHAHCLRQGHAHDTAPVLKVKFSPKHTYIHTAKTYIHTYTHAYMHTYMHAYMHTYMHAYIHTYIHTNIHRERERAYMKRAREREKGMWLGDAQHNVPLNYHHIMHH